jgi:putative acetyltransferase
VADLLRQSTEYASSLYPAESNHLDDVDELSRDNVYLVGAFCHQTLVGIGAVKRLAHDVAYGEIKRLYVVPAQRGQGLAKRIMDELEDHLRQRGIGVARLETGIYQPEALGLYKKLGYRVREPFGEYQPDPLSVFMEKRVARACAPKPTGGSPR